MAAIFECVVCVAVVAAISVHGQVLAPSFMGSGNAGKNCKYEFVVPDKNGACSRGSAHLESKVDTLKQEIDKTRLQYISQNSVIQGELTKLQSLRGSLGNQLTSLSDQFKTMQTHMDSLTQSGHTANVDLQKVLMNTKDYFTKVMHDIDNKIFSLSRGVQKDAIEQSKVNAAIETQMTQQFQIASDTERKMKDLENVINLIKVNPGSGPTSGTVTTSGPTSPPNTAALTKLDAQLKDLVRKLEALNQTQFGQLKDLQQKTKLTEEQLKNHSSMIHDLTLETDGTYARVGALQKTLSQNRDIIVEFRRKNEPKINHVEAAAESLFKTVHDLKTQLNTVGVDAMNGKMNTVHDEHVITNLKMVTNLLTNRVKDIDAKLQKQGQIEKTLTHLQDQIDKLVPMIASSHTNGSSVVAVSGMQGGKTSPKLPVPPLIHRNTTPKKLAAPPILNHNTTPKLAVPPMLNVKATATFVVPAIKP